MHDDPVVWWILLTALASVGLYVTAFACVWPRARPLMPLWVLLLFLLLPPFFPLLLLYVLAFARPSVIVVRETARGALPRGALPRGAMRSGALPRGALPQ